MIQKYKEAVRKLNKYLNDLQKLEAYNFEHISDEDAQIPTDYLKYKVAVRIGALKEVLIEMEEDYKEYLN